MENGKGLIHIYFGNGKGKTTAALGLAVRALGCKKKVCLIQFFKPKALDCGEHKLLKRFLGEIKIVRFCEKHPIFDRCKKIDPKALKAKVFENFQKVRQIVGNGSFDLIILDEILNLKESGLISERELVAFLDSKPKKAELVLTGRGKIGKLKDHAAYITNFRKIKHPFDSGIHARRGVEY